MPTSCSKQEGQTRLLKALSKPSWGWLPHSRMDSHNLWVIFSSAWLPSGGKLQSSDLSSFSFCPENLSNSRGRAVKSLAPCVWQPPHGPCLWSPHKSFPSPGWTSPAPLQGHAPAFAISAPQLHSLQRAKSCIGTAKICNTSQTDNIISVSIFPTVEEQLMRWQSETFKRQIWSQVEYHRSWFLV